MNQSCDSSSIDNFCSLVNYVIELIALLIPIIFGLIVIVLVWRLIDAWVINGGDTTKIAEGRRTALLGVIVLVILSGIWGILELLRSSFFGL